jgi:hypothetical protein
MDHREIGWGEHSNITIIIYYYLNELQYTNIPSGLTKYWDIVESLGNLRLLKKGSALRS